MSKIRRSSDFRHLLHLPGPDFIFSFCCKVVGHFVIVRMSQKVFGVIQSRADSIKYYELVITSEQVWISDNRKSFSLKLFGFWTSVIQTILFGFWTFFLPENRTMV